MDMAYGLIIPYGMGMDVALWTNNSICDAHGHGLWTKNPILNEHSMAFGVDFVSFYSNLCLHLNKIPLVVNYLMPNFFSLHLVVTRCNHDFFLSTGTVGFVTFN